MSAKLKQEVLVALVLIVFGLVALPAAVFWVGQHVVGQYGGGSNAWDLMRAIWLAMLQGQVAAWALVLSPYVVVQLVRLTFMLWRSGKAADPVNDVTISRNQRRPL